MSARATAADKAPKSERRRRRAAGPEVAFHDERGLPVYRGLDLGTSVRARRPARALPEQEHSEAGLALLLTVSTVLDRLGILDMFEAAEKAGEVTLNHKGPWDPDEMAGVRDALDQADLDASWVGGLTILVREVR
jgi:hypothetical protein